MKYLQNQPISKERFVTKPPDEEGEQELPQEHFRLKNVKTKAVAIVDRGAVPKSYWRLIKRKGEEMAEIDDTIKSLEEKIAALNLLFESLDQDRVTKEDIVALQEELESKLEAKLEEISTNESQELGEESEGDSSSGEENHPESEGNLEFTEEEYEIISETLTAIEEIQEGFESEDNDISDNEEYEELIEMVNDFTELVAEV